MKIPPVFIVGAGRSGTTLFYKLLCLHSDIAWISNYMQRLPRWPVLSYLNKVICQKKHRRSMWFSNDSNAYIKRKKILKRLFPMPVEGESVYNACRIPLYPDDSWKISAAQKHALHKYFDKIRSYQKSEVFLTKRTANNRRISQLLEAFPDSKFIHVIRDGRSVCRSLLNVEWWENHRVYWKELKTPHQLKMEGENPVHLAARNWVEEIKSISSGLEAVPPGQLLVVRYEDLYSDIDKILQMVVELIGLSNDPEWLDIVRSIKILNKNVQVDSFFKANDMAAIMEIQNDTLKHLGYIE